MQPRPSAARVHDVLGHRRVVRHEHRRLVHVAPHARDARVHQPRMQGAPPLPRCGVREIRERTQTRPHDVPVLGAVPRQAEEPALAARDVDRIRLVDLHARIGDHHDAEPLGAQLVDQPGRVREPLRVPGEDPVAVHVVDVQVEHVARDRARAELGRQGSNLVGVHVATTATAGSPAPTAAASACAPSGPCSARAPPRASGPAALTPRGRPEADTVTRPGSVLARSSSTRPGWS